MEELYNTDPEIAETPKTSSTDSKDNSKTTGDSQVQDGEGVVRTEEQKKSYEKSDEAQEYLEDANNNTALKNESPVQNEKGMTMSAFTFGTEEEEEEDDNEEDEPSTEIEIGDDPEETKKKIPII